MKFVAIGNVVIDQGLKDESIYGGSVIYSSLLALKLGLRTMAITSFGKDFAKLNYDWKNIQFFVQPAPFSTRVQLIYDVKGNRQIILKKEGGTISKNLLPDISDADIVFICPVVHEINSKLVSTIAKAKKRAIIVTTPQGWLRDWKKEGSPIFQTQWKNAKEILSKTDILIISDEDIKKDTSVLNVYRNFIKENGIVVVTQGFKGATAYRGKEIVFSKAYPAKVVDPTGAGDIFAASFAIAWKETSSLKQSLQFANLAASFVIEGIGTSNMPTRLKIRSRINKYQPHYK